MRMLLPAILLAATPMFAAETNFTTATTAINGLGVDLLHKAGKADGNFLISPYSIQSALAMTYAGAEGATRDEMAKVLHYPKDDAELSRSFAGLTKSLDELMQRSAHRVEQLKRYGGTNDPVELSTANRLFGQTGYNFRATFLAQLREIHSAPFEPMDFVNDAPGATKQINDWVEQQTHERICGLVPAGALDRLTRLVLVNAIYLKAPWEHEFLAYATKPRPFYVDGEKAADVPTMTDGRSLSYAKRDGFSVVAIPYRDEELQFVILLPEKTNGLAALENKLTAAGLQAACASLSERDVVLYLPKFKLEPPVLPLSRELQRLGLKQAFDLPQGSANFNRMAPRRMNDYLYISEIFHKTFFKLDEKGTEAAAATSVAFAAWGHAEEKPKPIEVKVDHPFVFAIQHRPSGACLFLGHVVDPR